MAGHTKKGILGQIKERNVPFLFAFIFVFITTLIILSALGAVPVPRLAQIGDLGGSVTGINEGSVTETLAEDPVRVVATSIRLDEDVSNPESSDIDVLDKALLKSTVRYPGSGHLNEEGNVLLFGHSSYLRTTLNPAYTQFNGIQNLKTGEIVTVYSKTSAYDYRVTSVKFAKADDFVIDLTKVGKRLTLVTCNSFATKSDRFVVEAEFVARRSL